MVMHVELQTTCSALGYQEGNTYQKEPDCIESVKDLIRFLKREDESCDIRRQLGEAQILQNDMVPILKQYPEDRLLWESTIRLLVNLTQPAVLCFQNNVPQDKTQRNYYLEIESQLQAYKEAFADEALFAVLTKKLGDLLKLDWENRQEEDRTLIERILILIRNILHVPPNAGREQRTDDDASVHDQLLWALHVSGLEDLLLYLASSDEERQYSFHVLEIISLMFREQMPEQLANAGETRSMSEKEKDERELALMREEERTKKKADIFKHSTRHSRFGGTFVVSNYKSISDKEVIYHRSLGTAKNISFDHTKVPKKKPRNRRPITEKEVTRRSTLSIRLALKDFCVQFLENCYNPLMYAVKDTLVRARAQENDETYYLWAMRFFMEFQRRHKFRLDFVSETMSLQTFHYIQTNMQNFHEMILANKKEGIIWSRRLHLALRAYQELLHTLYAMEQSKDSQLRESARVIKGNVFYMMEYRDIFAQLLKNFDETRQSRSFLRDLIESAHLFLKMLENFCKSHRHLVVQRKKKRVGKKKNPKRPVNVQAEMPSEEQLEEQWDDVSGELSALLQGRLDIPEGFTPFDAASEVDVDSQRADAMSGIQTALRENRPGEAVALLRASREVWPEREEFGRPDISPEEEFMALRMIFFADLANASQASQTQNEEEPEEVDDEDDEELQEARFEMDEQEFSFSDFIKKFAAPQVVRAYVTLLRDFRENSTYTNHCLVKMLHRLAYDCGLQAMLFQASLFRIFQKVICEPAVAKCKQYQELANFATHVVRKFFEVATTNEKVFVELFFYKNVKEAVEITGGYGCTSEKPVRWSEEEQMELARLYEECRDRVDEDGDMDVVDFIMAKLINQDRTRRQVVRQMVSQELIGSAREVRKTKKSESAARWREDEQHELARLYEQYKDEDGDVVERIMADMANQSRTRRQVLRQMVAQQLIVSAKDLRKQKGSGRTRGWHEEEEVELRELWDRWGRSDDPMAEILGRLSKQRSRTVVANKLLEMGLILDKKDLRKKRSAGRKSKRLGADDSDMENEVIENGLPSDFEEEILSEKDESGLSSASSSESEESDADEGDPLYVVQIKKLARKAHKKGHSTAVEWVARALTSVAEDREEEDDEEPVPLVPLTDEQEDAMEEKIFKNMLKKCGVKLPANEQERFWRIPGQLTPADLRSRAEALRAATTPTEGTDAIPSKKKSHFDALKEMVKQKKDGNQKKKRSTPRRTPAMEGNDNSNNDQENPAGNGIADPDREGRVLADQEAPKKSSPVLGKKKKSRLVRQREASGDEDSDGDTLQIDMEKEAPYANSDTTSQSKKRARALDSESESDDEPLAETTKRVRLMESNSEGESQEASQSEEKKLESFPATLLTVPMEDSDSDVEDHIPLKRAVNKRTVIESDSEED